MHPGQKLKPGAIVRFEGEHGALKGEVLDRRFFGRRTHPIGAGAWRQRDIGDRSDRPRPAPSVHQTR